MNFKKAISIFLAVAMLVAAELTLTSCQGEQGIQGEKGEQGIQGVQGEKGEQGIQGVQGEKGEQGIHGAQGEKGEQGIQGVQGEKGNKGDKGNQGDDGDTPYIGENGNWWIGETDTGVRVAAEKDIGLDYYPLPDGTYTVSGTRAIYMEEIVIPATYCGKAVTKIADSAFSKYTKLKSITIPDSVKSIGGSAFNGCTGLTNVTIGDGLKDIGWGAFYDCTGLTSITIPNRATFPSLHPQNNYCTL